MIETETAREDRALVCPDASAELFLSERNAAAATTGRMAKEAVESILIAKLTMAACTGVEEEKEAASRR